MPDTTQPVETEFANTPLYELPCDSGPRLRPFTVTIAGPERHDGERPYTVVVDAHSTERAWSKALAWFLLDQSTIDAYVIAEQSYPGAAPAVPGYYWTDLRDATAER